MADINTTISERGENDLRTSLDKWAKDTRKYLLKNISRLGLVKTGGLRSSLNYKITVSGKTSGRVQFSDKYYGKFLDMGVGRGQKLENVKSNREMIRAIGQRGRKGRKPIKWFTATMNASQNILARMVAKRYGLFVHDEIVKNIPQKIVITL